MIALWSAEAEYIALSTTEKELTWIRGLCWGIKFHPTFGQNLIVRIIKIFSENTAVSAVSNQQGLNA